MDTGIPRWTGDNAEALAEAPEAGVTWWALMDTRTPPLAVGSTPEEAEKRLRAVLLRYYRDEADPIPPDPEARAEREFAAWRHGAILSGRAPDELAAFKAWKLVSCLTMEEALIRWRDAFPVAVGVDPLVHLSGAGDTIAEKGQPRPTRDEVGGHRIRRRPKGDARG